MVATQPTLRELTASVDRCEAAGDPLTCPGVFEETGTDNLVFIGAKREVAGRVGPDECANALDRGLVSRAMYQGPISGPLRRGMNLLANLGL